MFAIRRALPDDALGIHEAHMRSIREVCSKDHTAEEIQGWGNRPYREDQRVNAIQKQHVWVVENVGKIAGYGHLFLSNKDDLMRGYVVALYLAPEANGRGLGAELIRSMIAEAQSKKAIEISLESTLTAHGFYNKMGFRDSGEQITVEVGGSKVRCIPMTLKL
ncbi:MAG: GNAT family N-acetyltransferase [Bdellovibrio sp.]